MPLTLVTGPANAEKARVVLDAYAAALDREPLLVVPRFADVQVYRRELAERGIVFGTSVIRFAWLGQELVRRAGSSGRPIADLARERVAALAIARTELRTIAAAAATPGFVAAFLWLADELGELRVEPQRWYAAVRAWAREEPGREAYAEDLGALYSAYRRGLDAVRRVDRPMHVAAALDKLRVEPARWRDTPVFFYGFDDLTRQQLDIVETLSVHVGADVTVSLPYEAGRAAFAGQDRTYQELLALGAREQPLEARSEHYAVGSRGALHHLERSLFAPDATRVEAGDAVLLLRGGGERAEIELVAAHVARLIGEGVAPGEIAVAIRDPERVAALVAQVFDAYGIPFALSRRIPVGHTALGRGLVALARCALQEGSADDLLAWLRTPGLLRRPELADWLEGEARRVGARSAAEVRDLWEAVHWPLDAIDRVRAAAGRGPAALCERLATEAASLFAAPHAGSAAVLAGAEAQDARVAGVLRTALGELSGLAQGDPALVPAPAELVRTLADLEVFVGATAGPDAVTVADPADIRARRVRALAICGLQEGAFPRPARAEPFLGDAERRAINAASGLRLRLHEDRLGKERSLFYAAVSRPTDLLILSWHAADDDGDPAVRSLFVDDVLDLFEPGLRERVQTRELGAAGWDDPMLAPTQRERDRAGAALEGARAPGADVIAALRDPAVLTHLAERGTWSASGLEAWLSCPVKWFVERLLRPEPMVPDPEPMVRGEFAHEVLERALGALASTAGGPLGPEHLDEAKRLAHAAIEELAHRYRISPNPERLRSALRRLEADVIRYLEFAARSGSRYAPAHFEVRFGGANDELEAVDLGDGLKLQGRIDRVDVGVDADDEGTALVYDYKGKSAAPRARWEAESKLQLALYMLALPKLLGLEAVGGLYQPLGADEPRPRGLLRDGADPGLAAYRNDRADEEAFTAALDAARIAAAAAVAEIRAGQLTPRPATCGWRDGGCSYPSICRCET